MLCGDRAKIDSVSGIAIVKSGFPIGLTPISFRFPVLGWFRMLKAPVFYPAARIISHFSPQFQTKKSLGYTGLWMDDAPAGFVPRAIGPVFY